MDNQFSNIFKALKNKNYIGTVIGEVIETFPNLRVSISDKIIIEKDNIVVSNHLMSNYKREFDFEGKITLNSQTELALAGVNGQAIENPSGHQHDINFNENDFKAKGKIKFTDTLLKGDIVLLIASSDNQIFFLIDKGVFLE